MDPLPNASIRTVDRTTTATPTLEGAGFLVHRPFPTPDLDAVDPFLLLDEMGPVDLAPGEAKGAPDHPHRGFETVTYVLSGQLEHRDSQGNAGSLGPGDVQWMTAGAGIIHSEMPSRALLEQGGRLHGFQLWVNLPAQDKMMRPRYQEIGAKSIPVAKTSDGSTQVKVLAGDAMGVRAVIDTRTPISYLHWTLQPGAVVQHPLPRSQNVFAYVIRGLALLGSAESEAGPQQAVLFERDGDVVRIAASPGSSEPLDLLLVAGEPLREPIARYGPFVMNNREEIHKAMRDYESGAMGKISADVNRF